VNLGAAAWSGGLFFGLLTVTDGNWRRFQDLAKRSSPRAPGSRTKLAHLPPAGASCLIYTCLMDTPKKCEGSRDRSIHQTGANPVSV
jgi:hypothetical protein